MFKLTIIFILPKNIHQILKKIQIHFCSLSSCSVNHRLLSNTFYVKTVLCFLGQSGTMQWKPIKIELWESYKTFLPFRSWACSKALFRKKIDRILSPCRHNFLCFAALQDASFTVFSDYNMFNLTLCFQLLVKIWH